MAALFNTAKLAVQRAGIGICHAADIVGDHQQPEVQVKRFRAGSGVLVILLVIAGENGEKLFVGLGRCPPVGAVCRVIVQHGGNKMIQQKIENDLSGQLQFQDAGRIEGEFSHGPFQDVNGDGVIGSFKQITAVGPGHDLFIFAGKR